MARFLPFDGPARIWCSSEKLPMSQQVHTVVKMRTMNMIASCPRDMDAFFLDESTKICGTFQSKVDARRCLWREINNEINPIRGFYGIPSSLFSEAEATMISFPPHVSCDSMVIDITYRGARLTSRGDQFALHCEAAAASSECVKSLTSTHIKIITSGVMPAVPHCYSFTCPKVAVSQCSNCLTATYCSEVCQIAHWPSHKRTCQKPCCL